MPTLYLVNPKANPSWWSMDVIGQWTGRPYAGIADLAIATVAAMAPPDFEVRLCDEAVEPADLDLRPDYVALTGKSSQVARMRELARHYRGHGVPVLIGGPAVSLHPEAVEGCCDVLVTGELEEIAGELFDDLRRRAARPWYQGGRPGLEGSPVPRWDLYPLDRAFAGTLQSSRGCPFECEFCDVIQYLGRKQRFKPVAQILEEAEALRRAGVPQVFLADDNFLVHRKRAREVLDALAGWNGGEDGWMRFATQTSVDAARDPELLDLCREAGLNRAFLGIETPNEESLRETRKRQNVGRDLVRDIETFLDRGVAVLAGMMVGFDHDGPDIFRRQFEFAMSTPVPVFTPSALMAPHGTPLHARLEREGRLTGPAEAMGAPWATNLRPARMSGEELAGGMRWLVNNLFSPRNFRIRLEAMAGRLARSARGGRAIEPGGRGATMVQLLGALRRKGPEERGLVDAARRWSGTPAASAVMDALFTYAQARQLLEAGGFWDPSLDGAPDPFEGVAAG